MPPLLTALLASKIIGRTFRAGIVLVVCCTLFVAHVANAQTSPAEICDRRIKEQLDNKAHAIATKRTEEARQILTPGPSISMLSNSGCASKELNKISNRITESLISPMNAFFRAEFFSLTSAAMQWHPRLAGFQKVSSDALSELLKRQLASLNPFGDELCGMMTDVVLNYIQCERPIRTVNLGDLTGPINRLLDVNSCGGAALRSVIYSKNLAASREPLAQSLGSTNDGKLLPRNTSR